MTTYISILRGINVSGSNIIKMEALKKMYEALGFEKVKTYLQSGNVIFKARSAAPSDLEQIIRQQIKNDFRFDVPVIVMTIDHLQQIIAANVYKDDTTKDPSFLHVTFFASQPATFDIENIESKKGNEEAMMITNNAVYLYCPQGYGKTKLTNNFLESKLGVVATTRNWRTTNELFKLAQEI